MTQEIEKTSAGNVPTEPLEWPLKGVSTLKVAYMKGLKSELNKVNPTHWTDRSSLSIPGCFGQMQTGTQDPYYADFYADWGDVNDTLSRLCQQGYCVEHENADERRFPYTWTAKGRELIQFPEQTSPSAYAEALLEKAWREEQGMALTEQGMARGHQMALCASCARFNRCAVLSGLSQPSNNNE